MILWKVKRDVCSKNLPILIINHQCLKQIKTFFPLKDFPCVNPYERNENASLICTESKVWFSIYIPRKYYLSIGRLRHLRRWIPTGTLNRFRRSQKAGMCFTACAFSSRTGRTYVKTFRKVGYPAFEATTSRICLSTSRGFSTVTWYGYFSPGHFDFYRTGVPCVVLPSL